MSKIAVTGAAGFVGRHLVPRLAESGHEVRALVREPRSHLLIPASGATYGDVRDARAARELVDGCTTVIHLAPGLTARDTGDMVVSGTAALLRAAKNVGVGRFVFVSCLGAQAANHSAYYAAKWQAEQLIRGSDVPYVIVRPSLILGPDDGITAPLAALLRSLPAVPLPGNGMRRQQPIDVDDFVQCILHSLESTDVLNQEISIGGPMYITPRQLVDLIGGALGVHKPKVALPPGLLAALGSRRPHRLGLFSPARVAQLNGESAASPGIVQNIFGFAPRSVVPRLGGYVSADTLS